MCDRGWTLRARRWFETLPQTADTNRRRWIFAPAIAGDECGATRRDGGNTKLAGAHRGASRGGAAGECRGEVSGAEYDDQANLHRRRSIPRRAISGATFGPRDATGAARARLRSGADCKSVLRCPVSCVTLSRISILNGREFDEGISAVLARTGPMMEIQCQIIALEQWRRGVRTRGRKKRRRKHVVTLTLYVTDRRPASGN